jgi:D-tyrosyl-tRNA(Tyr) deacylase
VRALVQRVSSALVRVDGGEQGRIGPGMLVYLGVGRGDGPAEADRLAARLGKLRIFDDGDGRPNEALGERGVLCVSQFTLYADTSRGNRPGYSAAADPALAEPLYERVCDSLGAERGVFGARMEVESVNDGPLTLLIEVEPAASANRS